MASGKVCGIISNTTNGNMQQFSTEITLTQAALVYITGASSHTAVCIVKIDSDTLFVTSGGAGENNLFIAPKGAKIAMQHGTGYYTPMG